MGRKLGYARVSTDDQELQLQLDALEKAGCEVGAIYTDKVSGVKAERPGPAACLGNLEAGDRLGKFSFDSTVGRSKEMVRHV